MCYLSARLVQDANGEHHCVVIVFMPSIRPRCRAWLQAIVSKRLLSLSFPLFHAYAKYGYA